MRFYRVIVWPLLAFCDNFVPQDGSLLVARALWVAQEAGAAFECYVELLWPRKLSSGSMHSGDQTPDEGFLALNKEYGGILGC